MARQVQTAILAAMLLASATATWANAPPETQPSPLTVAAPVAAPEKKWEFATIGYMWFAGAHGETDVIKPLPPVGFDLSFHTILKRLKLGFMGAAEARHDRLVILGDIVWLNLKAKRGIDIRDRDFLEAELDSNTLTLTALGGYRAAEKGPVIIDLLVGGRLNRTKTALTLRGPKRTLSGGVAKTWLDPVIAARVNAPLGDSVSVTLYGDAGGVVVGSDVSWQGVATVNYQVSRKIRLAAGWRYLKVDYDKGDFVYDVDQSGPIIIFRTDF